MADPLEDLQKKLYSAEKPTVSEAEVKPPPEEPPPPLVEEGDINPSSAVWRRIFIGGAIFVLLAATVAVYVFFRGFYAFRKDRVELDLAGPAEAVSGETVVWKLALVNKNETELKDGELIFQFPEFSRPIIPASESSQFRESALRQTITIAEMKPGGLYEREFKAMIYGGENFEREVRAVFKFKPSSGSIVFESTAEAVTRIASFPVAFTVEAVSETVSGEKVEVKFNLSNESDFSFPNARVRLEYPSGFRLEESSEKLQEFNNVWRLDELLPRESKALTLKGTVTGLEGERKIFRAYLESAEGSLWKTYKETSGETRLITPPLALYLNTEPESVMTTRPGETVFYKFVWQNNLDAPLANLTLKIKFESDNFDLSSLEPDIGFNSASRTIVLNRDNFPAFFGLQPLERGEFALKVKIKDKISGEAKLPLSAVLDSTSKPEGLAISKISASQNLSLEIAD